MHRFNRFLLFIFYFFACLDGGYGDPFCMSVNIYTHPGPILLGCREYEIIATVSVSTT
jgi:hypothetical protein